MPTPDGRGAQGDAWFLLGAVLCHERLREFDEGTDLGWHVALSWQYGVDRLATGRPCFENRLQPSIRDVGASGGVVDLGHAGPFGGQIRQADAIANDYRDRYLDDLGLTVASCETPLRDSS